MLATPTKELLRHLRTGEISPADTDFLDRADAREFVTELRFAFGFTFQQYRRGKKQEIALARSVRADLVGGADDATGRFIPAYIGCLMLSIEENRVTGISAITRLTLQMTDDPIPTWAVTTASGFKLQKMPDGWEGKRLRKRTVKLTQEFLSARGWRFGHLRQLIRTA